MEEAYRTVYVKTESENIGAMIRMNADVEDFKKVVRLALKRDGGDDRYLRDLKTGELVTDQIFRSIENFYFGKSETKTSIDDFSGSFPVVKTFAGRLYDGMKTECLIVRTKKELDDFTSKWILKSHPKFMPGARKIVGHEPSRDPLLTGKSKIDFDRFSLVFVFGQRTVGEVSSSGRNVLVYWRYDWTKRTSNSYGAALVPAIPSGLQVNLRWMLIAPPLSSFRIGLRPMASSHPIRRRVTGPPRTGRPPRKGPPPRTQALLDARRKKMRQAAAAAPPAKKKQATLRRSARIAALNKQGHNSR